MAEVYLHFNLGPIADICNLFYLRGGEMRGYADSDDVLINRILGTRVLGYEVQPRDLLGQLPVCVGLCGTVREHPGMVRVLNVGRSYT